MHRLFIITLLLAVPFLLNCNPSEKKKTNNFNSTNINNFNNQDCLAGSHRCLGSVIQICEDKQWINETMCGVGAFADRPVCDPGSLACAQCIAGGTTCGADNHVHICNSDGTIGLVQTECDSTAGEQCAGANGTAGCDSPCIRAASTKSYRGCEYWAVGMSNSLLSATFAGNFAVAVDNDNDAEVRVMITGGGVNVDQLVPARTLQVFQLNYVEAVRSSSASGFYRTSDGQGAYRVQASLPVTVYQFNPYDFVLGGVNSYTNDASLLLPQQVLSTNYLVMTRPTWVMGDTTFGDDSTSPGVVTIVATEDNTSVLVQTRSYVAGGTGVPALSPGGSNSFAMNRGDQLQLFSRSDLSYSSCPSGPGSATSSDGSYGFCNPGNAYDLTGMMVTSSAPIAVWGGHNCTFIPYNSWACDHLEEQMFPLETWGKRFMVGLTRQITPGNSESNMIRILAADNNTNISFNPASVAAPLTLQMGEYVEFMPTPNTHFEVLSTGPIMIGKFTVGQDYAGNPTGDPAFGLVVPQEQYRSEYNFTTPPSMTNNFVNVIAMIPTDSTDYIVLDGTPITINDYIPIGSTGYGVAQIDVTSTGTGGAHRIAAPNATIRFGIEVYGYAAYTSYLYPGGLDLEYINPVD
ncbi:IgGFc-binding protein [Myxococcota bacterium]|nr:IgGFc-binding protein [Myxococcota bacterium]MBU1510980.1 IgGFc-binding protein [Myxococcota bacterium]